MHQCFSLNIENIYNIRNKANYYHAIRNFYLTEDFIVFILKIELI